MTSSPSHDPKILNKAEKGGVTYLEITEFRNFDLIEMYCNFEIKKLLL